MGKSAKGKKSNVPVIGEMEYERYLDFLRREGETSSPSSLKNVASKTERKGSGEDEDRRR